MTDTQKLVLNLVGRFAMGLGAGLFLSKLTLNLMKNEKLINKLIIFAGSECCALGIGHGIDLFMDRHLPSLEKDEWETEKELWKTEE